jgi:hypothetical protein
MLDSKKNIVRKAVPVPKAIAGMRGVYMVAAELSKLGLIVSTTSRNTKGADILATNWGCSRAWSIQVKTNSRTHGFWLLNPNTKEMVSASHIYAFVNIRTSKTGESVEYFYVPSQVVAERMVHDKGWFAIFRDKILDYDKLDIFFTK